MNKHLTNLCLLLVLVLGLSYQANAQCPACTINVPGAATMPVDTIFLDTFPPAQKNQPYLQELSFRLPQTTTPIAALDPTTPTGLSLTSVTITGVSGLPLGMSYILDRAVPATYDAPTARDGCVTLCGTPTQSGLFSILLDVDVIVGGVISQSATFPLDFLVLPDSSAGFAVSASQGCDSLWVNFTNNIVSGGNPNFSYDWDFGNGQTSSLENPDSVLYSDTGTYVIQYQAIVDTFPYQLTQVVIIATDCNDDIPPITTGAPDLYMILDDSSGTELVNNDPNTTPIIGTAPNDALPDTVWTGSITMEDGAPYSIEIWDDDNDIGNGDDPCGTYTITSPLTSQTLVNGANAIEITVVHYVDTITTTETIVVNDCTVSGTGYEQVDNSLRVFPNPTNGLVNVRFHLYGMAADASLQVTDLLGRTLHTENLGGFEGNYNEAIDLSAYDDGVYILTLQVGENISHRKIVLSK
jgi:hypothetical protein